MGMESPQIYLESILFWPVQFLSFTESGVTWTSRAFALLPVQLPVSLLHSKPFQFIFASTMVSFPFRALASCKPFPVETKRKLGSTQHLCTTYCTTPVPVTSFVNSYFSLLWRHFYFSVFFFHSCTTFFSSYASAISTLFNWPLDQKENLHISCNHALVLTEQCSGLNCVAKKGCTTLSEIGSCLSEVERQTLGQQVK